MDTSQIGKRAWSYAGVLQDAGLSCFEYVEQMTLLLFLKMADQLTEAPHNKQPIVPPALGWKALLPLDGAALEEKYREILEKLGVKTGMLGVIFKGARCEINNPALLKQLIVNLLDKVDWLSLPVDVKGTIYEELLQRSAQESSRGAGQYFTPRPVIQTMCEVTQPTPQDRICDPAAGTGGFLCNAYQYVLDRFGKELDRDEKRALQEELVEGMELSPKVGRMCAMNLYLHGIGGEKVRRNLLQKCRVHTLLRLPTGIWYSPGVKANVIFFDKKEGRAAAWTDKLWVYDLRTNMHFTLKQSPIQRKDFDEFVVCYQPGRLHKRKETWSESNPEGRWRCFAYDDLLKRDKLSLDLFWIKDKSLTDTDSLHAPDILATEIADDLETALEQFTKIAARLKVGEGT